MTRSLRTHAALADPGVARAALWLAALGLAGALPAPGGPAAPCATPHEVAQRGGWSAVVRCQRAPAGEEPEVALRGPARLLFGLRLDLNRADAATLEALPGIGSVRAASIVAQRPFARVEDLRRVPGVGARRLEALRAQVAAGARSGPERP